MYIGLQLHNPTWVPGILPLLEDDEDSDNDNFALHNPNAHINRHCLPLNRTTQHLKFLPKLETGALRVNGALEPNQQTRGQNCIERSTMHGDLCIGVTQKCRLLSISLDFKLKKPKRPSRHRHISSPLVKSPAQKGLIQRGPSLHFGPGGPNYAYIPRWMTRNTRDKRRRCLQWVLLLLLSQFTHRKRGNLGALISLIVFTSRCSMHNAQCEIPLSFNQHQINTNSSPPSCVDFRCHSNHWSPPSLANCSNWPILKICAVDSLLMLEIAQTLHPLFHVLIGRNG